MFERFTDRARRVIKVAQEEAQELGHNYIGTEHLLLGLIAEPDGIGAKVLVEAGLELSDVRRDLLEVIGRGPAPDVRHIPFTPRAKKVLELSLREALNLGHNYIGTEHLLLGLVRETHGVAAQMLVRQGLQLDEVRARVISRLTLIHPVEQAAGGETVTFRAHGREKRAQPVLTDREAEVLRLLGEGSAPFDVAKALLISENTVKDHIRNVVAKLTQSGAGIRFEPKEVAAAGPSCPNCNAALANSARYRTLDVSQDQGDQTATVLFLYCSSCGVTIDDLILPDEP